MDAIYGEGVIGLRAIHKWTRRFEEGNDSFEDEFRPLRRRSIKHCDAIRTLLDENQCLSQK
jgi:hypothetical protein